MSGELPGLTYNGVVGRKTRSKGSRITCPAVFFKVHEGGNIQKHKP